MTDIPTVRHFKPEAEVKSHPITLAEYRDILQQVARVLLQHAGTDTTRRPGLSQREMAAMLGTSWDMVNSSLKSLQTEGAIRIERHRMVINKKALEQIAMEKGFKYQKSEAKSSVYREANKLERHQSTTPVVQVPDELQELRHQKEIIKLQKEIAELGAAKEKLPERISSLEEAIPKLRSLIRYSVDNAIISCLEYAGMEEENARLYAEGWVKKYIESQLDM